MVIINEIVGGGEGGQAKKTWWCCWSSEEVTEWVWWDGAGVRGLLNGTKRQTEVRGQGSSMERGAARNSGYLGGQRWTSNEQEQKRSNFCAFLRPLQRGKTRRDRCRCFLLVRVWTLIKAVYQLISFSIITCRSIHIIRSAVVILLKTKYGHAAADK